MKLRREVKCACCGKGTKVIYPHTDYLNRFFRNNVSRWREIRNLCLTCWLTDRQNKENKAKWLYSLHKLGFDVSLALKADKRFFGDEINDWDKYIENKEYERWKAYERHSGWNTPSLHTDKSCQFTDTRTLQIPDLLPIGRAR